MHCVLDVRGGPSRRVGPGGVLIGRQSDCDIVAADPSVSRRHALVRLTGFEMALICDSFVLVDLAIGPPRVSAWKGRVNAFAPLGS